MNNTICLLVGESGSGKTTIAKALEDTYGLKSIASYTTRPPRYEGEEGHTFVSEKEFDALTDFIAYTEFCGNRYAATVAQVEEADLYVIDLDGVNCFKQNYRGDKQMVMVYIHSPIHTRVDRMEQRGDNFGAIMERIVNDVTAFGKAKECADYIIFNNDDTKVEDIAKDIYTKVFDTNEEVKT